MGPFLFEKRCYLFACCTVDAFVGNLAFPLLKKEVLLAQRFEAPPFERVITYITDGSFDFAFVLGLVGPTGHHVDAVVPAEVGQLAVNFWIEPIGFQDRRFEVVQVQ